ncbi:MAG: hypothetical protein Q4E67_00590 [Planctomycetia bacterium]|nr:hypothetical protein [Planctomycetia bacterium]
MLENKMRWKWGETSPITAEVASSVVIHAGDLLWMDTNNQARPASDFAYDTSLTKTQEKFAEVFLGIAMENSPAGTSGYIRIATTGTFELDDTTDTSVALGNYVAPVLNSAGTYLERSAVAKVTASYQAIGRICHTEKVPESVVFVAIISTILRGGVAGSDPKHTDAPTS